ESAVPVGPKFHPVVFGSSQQLRQFGVDRRHGLRVLEDEVRYFVPEEPIGERARADRVVRRAGRDARLVEPLPVDVDRAVATRLCGVYLRIEYNHRRPSPEQGSDLVNLFTQLPKVGLLATLLHVAGGRSNGFLALLVGVPFPAEEAGASLSL